MYHCLFQLFLPFKHNFSSFLLPSSGLSTFPTLLHPNHSDRSARTTLKLINSSCIFYIFLHYFHFDWFIHFPGGIHQYFVTIYKCTEHYAQPPGERRDGEGTTGKGSDASAWGCVFPRYCHTHLHPPPSPHPPTHAQPPTTHHPTTPHNHTHALLASPTVEAPLSTEDYLQEKENA